jgi:hypothetical protein
VRAARANASAIHSADERMASAATTLIARSISATELRTAQVASVQRAVRMNDMVAPLFGHAESASASALDGPESTAAVPAASSFLMAGSSDIVASSDLAADLALRDTGFTPFALPQNFQAVSASSFSVSSSSSSTSEPQSVASAASLADRVAEAEREAARFEATVRESSRQLNAAARQFEASLYGEFRLC